MTVDTIALAGDGMQAVFRLRQGLNTGITRMTALALLGRSLEYTVLMAGFAFDALVRPLHLETRLEMIEALPLAGSICRW